MIVIFHCHNPTFLKDTFMLDLFLHEPSIETGYAARLAEDPLVRVEGPCFTTRQSQNATCQVIN